MPPLSLAIPTDCSGHTDLSLFGTNCRLVGAPKCIMQLVSKLFSC